MALHEEAIKVRTSLPSATPMRAYMVVVDGELSGAQHPTPDREGNPQHSPHDCHLGGSTQHQLQANLRDHAEEKLWQLMEDLCWEVTLRELNTPPRDPPLTPWGNPVGIGDLDVDDWKVNFLRGGGWEPIGQPLPAPAPTQPGTGWRPREQPPHPQHLLNPRRHGTSYKHTGHGIASWYPLYKHF